MKKFNFIEIYPNNFKENPFNYNYIHNHLNDNVIIKEHECCIKDAIITVNSILNKTVAKIDDSLIEYFDIFKYKNIKITAAINHASIQHLNNINHITTILYSPINSLDIFGSSVFIKFKLKNNFFTRIPLFADEVKNILESLFIIKIKKKILNYPANFISMKNSSDVLKNILSLEKISLKNVSFTYTPYSIIIYLKDSLIDYNSSILQVEDFCKFFDNNINEYKKYTYYEIYTRPIVDEIQRNKSIFKIFSILLSINNNYFKNDDDNIFIFCNKLKK